MTVDRRRLTETFSPNGPGFRAWPGRARQPEAAGFEVERLLSDRYRHPAGPWAPDMIVAVRR